MSFKHYGGSVPAGPQSWVCPSCAAENTVPLKAGCQSCGAGADARKVAGEPQRVVGEVQVGHLSSRESNLRPEDPTDRGFYMWMLEEFPKLHARSSETDKLKEAFMAGVAWAQAQPTLGGVQHTYATAGSPNPVIDGAAARAHGQRLWMTHGVGLAAADAVEDVTHQTILAALAFYRDNVLNYGAIAGQLDAAGVTALIARLTPEEPEA